MLKDKSSEMSNKTIKVICDAKLNNWLYLSEQGKKNLKVIGKNKCLTNSQWVCTDAIGNQLFYLISFWNILLSGSQCKSSKTMEDHSQNISDSRRRSGLEILI